MNNFERKLEHLHEETFLGLEFVNMICGKYIGGGSTRMVYEYRLDPRYVVKVEYAEATFGDNIIEWRIWDNVKHTTDGTKDWFAECLHISPNGRILVQRRTNPLHTKHENKLPEKIPAWFTDIKRDNFGWIGNQVVCHDYAYCLERFGYFALKNKWLNFKHQLDNH